MGCMEAASFCRRMILLYTYFDVCQHKYVYKEGVMIKYKIDILKELKSAGFTTYRLRKEKLLSEGTVQKIRENSTGLTLEVVDRICTLLHCQPGDLIEWVPEDEE